MPTYGCFLSSEENDPRSLVEQAQMAERAGLDTVSISDHFHPWMDSQGESPFVWSVIGGIAATSSLTVTTAVTCPILRVHPAIVAQAAATSSEMLCGRFRLGVGTGERLNEHVLGQHWPPAEIRRDMLGEAVSVMRELWAGDLVTRRGTHYTVENARLYTQPRAEIPVIVSAFGPDAAALAAEVGDGLMTTAPDDETLRAYAGAGGSGPMVATVKACWGPDEAEAEHTAHRLWASSGIPGESSQELATPRHFEEAAHGGRRDDGAHPVGAPGAVATPPHCGLTGHDRAWCRPSMVRGEFLIELLSALKSPPCTTTPTIARQCPTTPS